MMFNCFFALLVLLIINGGSVETGMITESRTELTISGILEYIQDNNLRAGDMLPPEIELSSHLNTSRTILREAISYLKGLGILTSRRGSGYQLQKVDPISVFNKVLRILTLISAADIGELKAMRRILELGSIETAVDKSTAEHVKNIENITVKMRKASQGARAATTYGEYNTLETDFHQAIMAPSGNKMLTTLNAVIKIFFDKEKGEDRGNPYPPEDLKRDTAEHILIAAAFTAGNPEAAYAALKEHERLPMES
ncbi:MAG: FadR family transcriptional regulator [Spirochaetales bacterium]|nr:FadR family transcriptional regulator [Spirochaetales bacterium]